MKLEELVLFGNLLMQSPMDNPNKLNLFDVFFGSIIRRDSVDYNEIRN
jgi:hypothetical protein